MPLVLAWLVACDAVPTAPSDIDNALATNDLPFACAAFKSDDAELRVYAAKLLAESGKPDAVACTCAGAYDPATGKLDLEVTKAAQGSKSDAFAACFAPALTDARVDRPAAIEALAPFKAPSAGEAIRKVAEAPGEAGVRAAGMRGLRFYDDANPTLIAALQDPEPAVRAAAASALERHKDQGAILALDALVEKDPSAEVRAAVAGALASMETLDGDYGACRALVSDADPVVRAAPLKVWQAQQARRVEVIQCLQNKLGAEEAELSIRAAVIAHLKMARTPDAEIALCDAIGPYVKANVKDAIPEEGAPDDLISVQNLNRYDLTLGCVQRALAKGGYTCHGRYWLAWWVQRTGGSASAPTCPGMTSDEAITTSGPREISF